MSPFPKMVDVVPEGEHGSARIEHCVVNKRLAELSTLRSMFSRDDPVREGSYVRLYVGGELMMSDTDAERSSNLEVVIKAKGRVLIAGLGVGMILCPILANQKVQGVEVVESSPDVIQLVEPALRGLPGAEKLNVVEADILTWKPPRGSKWDTIYFDIWPDICLDNLPQMQILHRRFGRYKNPGGWMGSWQHERLLLERSRMAQQGRRW